MAPCSFFDDEYGASYDGNRVHDELPENDASWGAGSACGLHGDDSGGGVSYSLYWHSSYHCRFVVRVKREARENGKWTRDKNDRDAQRAKNSDITFISFCDLADRPFWFLSEDRSYRNGGKMDLDSQIHSQIDK